MKKLTKKKKIIIGVVSALVVGVGAFLLYKRSQNLNASGGRTKCAAGQHWEEGQGCVMTQQGYNIK